MRDWVERTPSHDQQFSVGLWIVELKDTREIVGQSGLTSPVIHDMRREWEVGCLFLRRHWGHGYATESARAARDLAFAAPNADHAISIINPDNQPSIKDAERSGMTRREVTA